MVVCESPVAAAIERIDQWVASFGVAFSVRSITSATCASDTVRGRPMSLAEETIFLRGLQAAGVE
jgi:hypothetical protein